MSRTTRSRGGRRSQHDRAAGAAAAPDRADAVGRVVVRDLLALADVAGGADPDRVAGHLGIAVGRAGVVDVPRHVAADGGVAHVQPVQLEAPDVALLQVPHLAPEALLVGDLFTRVVDDAGV